MDASLAALLPADASRRLAEGDVSGAGELLRERGEHLARSDPGHGRRWSELLLDRSADRADIRPWAQWAAATVFYLCGDAIRAESLLSTAARAFRSRRRTDLADRIGLILVDLYGERLELPKARRLAAGLARRFRAQGHRERAAAALANLAAAEDAADHVAVAARLWRTARRDLDEGGVNHLMVTANLANVAALEGRLDEALAGHRHVAMHAAEHGLEAIAIQASLNLAETEFALGRVDEALRRWHQTAERAAAAGLPLFEALASIELARAELDLGHTDAAARRLGSLVDELDRMGLVLEQARAWRLLAVTEAGRPRPDASVLNRARSFLRRTGLAAQRDLLEIDLALLDPDADPGASRSAARRLLGRGLRQRGLLGLAWSARRFADHGQPATALRLAREVLSHRRLSPWIRMTAHHVCARCLPEGSTASLRHARLAVRDADRVHGRLSSAADRSAFLRARGEVYVDLVWKLVERGRPADRRQCLDLVSTLKSGWLVDQLTRRADRGDDAVMRRWQDLRRRLATLVELAEGEDEPRVRHVGVGLNGELRRLEAELADIETEVRRLRPGLLLGETSEASRGVLRHLAPDHLYVEYLVGKQDLVMFVVHQGQVRVHRHEGVGPELQELVDSVRFHMDTHAWADQRHLAARQRSLEHRLRRLGTLLLDGIPEDGWKVLWIAPDDGLYHLPWSALEDRHGRPLIERGAITLVPGSGIAAALLGSSNPAPRTIALAGAGGDTLELVDAEIRDLGRLLPGSTRRQATTRQQLLDVLADHEMVHVAGHALFLDGVPGASGLRLEDGFVTVHDLAAARIRARTVCFGVCSGLRITEKEPNRFEGFLRALLGSGVRTVVGPIARVRDHVAHAFALSFHSSLKGSSHPALAFREAVTELRGQDPHPATWGNFHIYGDGRPWRTA